jgi:hypothetical protein
MQFTVAGCRALLYQSMGSGSSTQVCISLEDGFIHQRTMPLSIV